MKIDATVFRVKPGANVTLSEWSKSIDEADKNWKFSRLDMHERQYWKQYMKAYEECLSATSTDHTPWHVVPADDKKNARLIVSQIMLDAFKTLHLADPTTSASRRKELHTIRKQLTT